MEIIEQIGSYAGLASIVGLAVLSALYFSQARDVKRLREWAGRAPERAEQVAVPGRVVAQPQSKPGAGQPVAPTAPKPMAPGGLAAPMPAAPAVPEAAPVPVATAATGARPAIAGANAEKAPAGVPVGAAATPAGAAAGAPSTPADAGAAATPAGNSTSFGPQASVKAPPGPTEKRDQPAAPPGVGGGPAPPKAATPAGQARPPAVSPASRPPVRTGAPTHPSPQQTAVIPPPARSGRDRLLDSPRYLMLAAAGVLILGAGVVFGVTQLSGGEDGAAPRQASDGSGDDDRQAGGRQRPVVNPSEVTVAVLNGTTVPGLAAQLGDQVERFGFELGTVDNALNQQSAESRVLYGSGHEREAAAVSRKLGIAQREPIDPDSQGRAGDASVVVVAGADQTP